MSATERAILDAMGNLYTLLANLRTAADRATDDAVTADLVAIHDQVATTGERLRTLGASLARLS